MGLCGAFLVGVSGYVVVRDPTRSYVKPRGRTLEPPPPAAGYDHATPSTTAQDPETPNHRHPLTPTTPSHTKNLKT